MVKTSRATRAEAELQRLAREAAGCQNCDLYKNATQTVFGRGATDARLILVGEQPGDQEDLAGRPFVGPAGRLLDEALAAAGIERDEVYVTNVVKHFKWEERGKRRIHQKPGSGEIAACFPWLEAELAVVKPAVLVLLGATAAQALLGRAFRVTRHRGEILVTDLAPAVLATLHPSAILRMPDREERHREVARFTRDMRLVARTLRGKAA
jgi:uracil-DNA glycosylase family protein